MASTLDALANTNANLALFEFTFVMSWVSGWAIDATRIANAGAATDALVSRNQ